MTITGRMTADAVVNETKDGRKVVNFSIAVNETFKPKGGERVKATAFFHCSYWMATGVAQHLKKGTIVEVFGRVYASAYLDKEGQPQASLNCHVNHLKLLSSAGGKEVTPANPTTQPEDPDDIPF